MIVTPKQLAAELAVTDQAATGMLRQLSGTIVWWGKGRGLLPGGRAGLRRLPPEGGLDVVWLIGALADPHFPSEIGLLRMVATTASGGDRTGSDRSSEFPGVLPQAVTSARTRPIR